MNLSKAIERRPGLLTLLLAALTGLTSLSPAVTVAAFATLTLLASGHVRLPFGRTEGKRGEALHVTCGT